MKDLKIYYLVAKKEEANYASQNQVTEQSS